VENPAGVAASGSREPANFCKELRPGQRVLCRLVFKALTLRMNCARPDQSQWQ